MREQGEKLIINVGTQAYCEGAADAQALPRQTGVLLTRQQPHQVQLIATA